MNNTDKISAIKEIISLHKGKRNAITARSIAAEVGISEDDTHSITRGLIYEVMRKHNLPIGGSSKGYYCITNEKELLSYVESLKKRIREIEIRIKIVETAFYKK